MTRWDQWLYGHHHIVVESDHKLLETISKHPISHARKHLPKILLRLQRYTFTIVHRKGSTMWLADTLSRAPLPRKQVQVNQGSVWGCPKSVLGRTVPKTRFKPAFYCPKLSKTVQNCPKLSETAN